MIYIVYTLTFNSQVSEPEVDWGIVDLPGFRPVAEYFWHFARTGGWGDRDQQPRRNLISEWMKLRFPFFPKSKSFEQKELSKGWKHTRLLLVTHALSDRSHGISYHACIYISNIYIYIASYHIISYHIISFIYIIIYIYIRVPPFPLHTSS